MGGVDLIKSCARALDQVSDHLEDAVLYLDAGSSEAFKFVGGVSAFLELGARAVCSLEQASPLDVAAEWHDMSNKPVQKMVVMTSCLLSDAHRYILRCLDMHRSIRHCIIFTSISENAHSAYVDAPLGPDAFREYESLLLQDYQELVLKSEFPQSFGETDNFEISFGTPDSLQKSITPKKEECLEATSSINAISDLEASSDRTSFHSPSPTSMKDEDWKSLEVSVKHFPMILCPLSPNVFVLPSQSAVAEARISDKSDNSLSPGLPPVSIGLNSDGDNIPPGATLIAHFLHHLAGQMDLKMDIFTLGPLSQIVGNLLTDLSSLYDMGGRAKRSTGLLLIDRTLDLITPCCHGDSLVDRLFSSLPRKDRNFVKPPSQDSVATNNVISSGVRHPSVDFKVPLETIFKPSSSINNGNHFSSEGMAAFMSGWDGAFGWGALGTNCGKNKEEVSIDKSCTHLDPMCGSLSSFGNHQDVHCLDALIDKRTKDGALLTKKWLQEALRQEKISVRNRLGGVTASELCSLLNALASNTSMIMRNRGIIHLAKAVEIALSEPWSTRWEAFASAEKILILSAGDTSQSLSGQIQDLIHQSVLWRTQNQDKGHEPPPGLLSMRDAIILAVVGYSLAGESFGSSGFDGPFSWEEEHSLKEAIVDAVLECSPGAEIGFLHGLEAALESHWKKSQLKNHNETQPEQLSDVEEHSSIDFDDQWGCWEEDEAEDTEQEYGEMRLKLELRDRLDSVFRVLHKISNARSFLPFKDRQFNLEEIVGATSSTNRGLISKVLSMAFAKSDIPGLVYHFSAVGRLFKSGFGRFGLGQAKPRLGDQSVIFVFVVGGFNALEVHEAREAHSSAGADGVELLFGGTTILTPNDIFELLLGSCSYI